MSRDWTIIFNCDKATETEGVTGSENNVIINLVTVLFLLEQYSN